MMKRIYVSNLPWSATEAELHELFSAQGLVDHVEIIKDRDTGRSKGFGFVGMTEGGTEAIAALNDHEFQGRRLSVVEARPRKQPHRPSRTH